MSGGSHAHSLLRERDALVCFVPPAHLQRDPLWICAHQFAFADKSISEAYIGTLPGNFCDRLLIL